MKKAALMIYPNFSLQEVTILTLLFMLEGKQLDVYAATKQVYVSEDNFNILPHKTFAEFQVQDYDVIILPGIFGFAEALDEERNISFLTSLKDYPDILIASISSSPVLLAKAGLLENKKFCSGLFEEAFKLFDFLPYENVVRKPIVKDGNILTAIGFAYREFAIEVANSLGMDIPSDRFSGIRKDPPYSEEELTFRSTSTN